MQTPLQKLILQYSNYANNEDDTVRNVVTEIIKDAELLLPYEKKCIYKSYDAGVEAMDKRGVEIRALCDVDEWFEETFNKPTKEKYGWVESSGFDSEPSGWAFEGGEEAYYKALELWENSN
jgi:hypothetical protein